MRELSQKRRDEIAEFVTEQLPFDREKNFKIANMIMYAIDCAIDEVVDKGETKRILNDATPSHGHSWFNDWQRCLICSGAGFVPPNGQFLYQSTWISTAPLSCPLCRGRKIISQQTGLPPV